MLDITVRTEDWRKRLRPSADELAALVRRVGGDGDRFLILQRVPDLPDVYAQVWHEHGDAYRLEHRDGGPDRHFETAVGDAGRAAAALAGWARAEDGWDAGLEWERLDFPPAPEVPELPAEVRAKLEERVRELLRCGYDDREALAEAAEEYLVSGDERPVCREQARELVDRLWLERVAESAGWQGVTDPERITAVFEELDRSGIVARENFTCCRSCGTAEIGAEEGASEARGFVYFHAQCTEGVAGGGALYLLYGGFDGRSETTAAVGAEVAAALRGRGLAVEWDGDPSAAILVPGLDWRKRLVG
ncbi:DUF6891 domain-containing protein [Streptomyces termitum]|uniref:DUF6891 domain-containing protein n=1 Tax=Streptomyces termitum TaxID=67368 RepID=A0A918WDM5_9ACTN|nr:hypothetical protein [Streptomyces termitum]GHB04496.1 hypothetical protein GCM10010305_54710 [Streptomyces termitum]